ncbi:MAG: carboxypeptidase regulatory-like domain-containing protein [Planctomycetota bacterium]
MRGARFLVLIAVLIAAAASLYSLWHKLGRVAQMRELEPPVASETRSTTASSASLSAVDTLDGAREQPIAVEAAAATESFSLDGAQWIEGVVRLPAGTPADERIEVWALRTPLNPLEGTGMRGDARDGWTLIEIARTNPSHNTWSRRPVDADGKFRVPIAADEKRVSLCVAARYAYLPEPVGFTVGESEQPVQLTPLLGACIAIECVAPAGAERELDGTPVTLGGVRTSSRGALNTPLTRTTRLDRTHALEFGGLPPALRYVALVVPATLATSARDGLVVEAGERAVVRLDVLRGARVSGFVRDDSDMPLADVRVWVTEPRGFAASAAPRERETTSGADGAYTLVGVQPGGLHVRAALAGYRDAQTDELALADGATHENIDLVLTRGLSIAGSVAWPDGRPASGATVRALVASGVRRRAPLEARSGDDGRFQIQGLDAGEFQVDASIADPAATGAADAPAAWSCTAEKVAAGTNDVVLALAPPADLAAHVVDETGAPVSKFRVSASLQGVVASGLATRDRSSPPTDIDAADGRFVLHGLRRGSWTVSAEADGYTRIDKLEPVTLPQQGGELTIVLHRAGSVAGLVLDPSGTPAARARVAVRAGGASALRAPRDGRSGETDPQGRFVLDKLPPGEIELVATHDSWAASAPATVQVRAPERTDGVVLALRLGGTLTGEVFDTRGEPVAGRDVHVFSISAGETQRLKSDGAGRFRAERLTPGNFQVVAEPTRAERDALRERARADAAELFEQLKMASVVIEDGQTAHVVLGAPPKAPVRMFGRVTRGGAAAAGYRVVAIGEGASLLQELKSVRADASGSYEITLDHSGDVTVIVSRDDSGRGGAERIVRVPEVPQFELDLAVPTGTIRGHVYGPDRRPLVDVGVQLTAARESSSSLLFSMMRTQAHVVTDESGAYEHADLEPGTYTVAAGGAAFQYRNETTAQYGRTMRTGIEVGADATVEGVDLVLPLPGKLGGTVKDTSGMPVAGATVFVRDASGEPLTRLSSVTTDAAGRFVYAGVGPGVYSLSARTKSLASNESAPVSVREGTQTEVALVMEPGTMVIVTVTEGDAPARASVTVRDEKGREMSQLVSLAAIERLLTEGVAQKERRIGPLPSGEYTIEASTPDGRTAKKRVTLRGQEDRTVVLRLDG